MRTAIACLLILAAAGAIPACAQAPTAARNVESLELPLAGPPPAGDLLPPLPPHERAKAAVEMLALVVLGLVLVVVGLRWVSRFRKPEELVTPEQQFVERVHKVLDETERKSDAKEETRRS
jgi:hypothetical protein